MNDEFKIPLDADQLMARAREITGIDRVDREGFEPLQVLLKSLNEDSRLSERGAAAMQSKLLRLLCNRLRMQRDFANHPEIAEQIIQPPVVICGMARTGSTKLQKMLAASGDFNWLPFWQGYNPSLISGSRDESPSARIKDAEEYCTWFDIASPDNKYAHDLEPHEPDEESYMVEQSLQTACFIGWSELPGYLQWLSAQDNAEQFRYLHQLLQYLQWQGLHSEGKRWVLKCPLYFGLIRELLSVFPDANMVMTHRHPLQTIPSSAGLLTTFHAPFTEAPIDLQAFLAGMAAQMDWHFQIRTAHPDIRFLDVDFKQIIDAAPEVMQKIYKFCGMQLHEASLQRVIAWNQENPMNKKGVHKYSMADFGFTEAMINSAFAVYIKNIAAM
jgi:hypothetical protein